MSSIDESYHRTVKWQRTRKGILLSVWRSRRKASWQNHRDELLVWHKRWSNFLLTQHDWWWDKWKRHVRRWNWTINLSCQRVRRIAKSVIEWPELRVLKAFGCDLNHAYCTFRNSSSKVRKSDDSSCSTMIYQFEDRVSRRLSSSLSLCQACVDKLIWDLSRRTSNKKRYFRRADNEEERIVSNLNKCRLRVLELIISRFISDARLVFIIVQETVIIFEFEVKKKVEQWVKMKLLKSRKLEEKVKAMKVKAIETRDIYIENFVFE